MSTDEMRQYFEPDGSPRIMGTNYEYTPPPPPEKPKSLRGEMSKAWDYLVNRGGCCKATEFDEDFQPIGPKLRYDLFSYGVHSSTSGKVTIIFFA